MDNAGYATLTRQSGLLAEMRVIANNIANTATTGYRAEGVVFSEFVAGLDADHPSLSMAAARGRETMLTQGTLERTGGAFDLAIEGEGFFAVQTPDGQRLTRAGSFTPNAQGDLVTPEGWPVLDAGLAPVFVPPGTQVAVGPDGTLSADGAPVGQVGLFVPADPLSLTREDGVRFSADALIPADNARIAQGFLEQSNVEAVVQIARMIEVQRAYELGQGFLTREDERIRGLIQAMSR
jgi:flagellar basal-body rod protein FlgF